MEKFFQIFQDLHFDISFGDALLLMPKFASTIKGLLTNKDKLFKLAKIPLNENCSAMLLKKLPEKLGDPDQFLIPCDFPRMDVCHALADLGASINLMPLSIWKKLSLPELTPTQMTLELADRSITLPKGVAEDVFAKVGKFYFSTDFVVVDFEADPRVPLILERSFLKTGCALIDVYREEITLRVNDEAVIFNLSQTTRYSFTYDDMSVNQTDVIDVVREEYAHEMLGFSNNSLGGNPTSTSEPIISDYSPSLTPFEGRDFILEEIEAYLKDLKDDEKEAILKVLKSHKRAIAWKTTDIKGINPRFWTHKILMEEDYKPTVQSQRWVNPKIHEVIKKEVIKLLDAGMIYPIFDSSWVIPIHCVPKKGGITVVENENNELIPTRLVTGWRVCIDYQKLNDTTLKNHFPLPFMDQMLERLTGNEFYCFLDGFSGYFQIPINPPDHEKTTFTCPYGTFAYRRMPFGLCNAPGTFQRCMMVIFHDMIEKTIEVFMDDFLVFEDSFSSCLSYLDTMLQRSIQDFSKIARPMTHILEKETPFLFSKDCIDAFETHKKKLTEASILVVPDWNLPFELMCDASDFTITAVLGQHFMGPFPSSQGNRYILVAVDYLSKWVEAKALPANDTRVVVKFLKSLFARFETPREHKEYWALKHVNFDLKIAGDHRKLQLNELNELRDQAYKNSLIYKEKTKKLYDSKIKNHIFNIGDRVLLFNSRLKIFSGKLKTHWSGPFTITKVFSYGTVKLSQPEGPNFKVNGHRVKHYFGGDIPQLVVSDL
nr:reverse transcriptase domain-containing protein, chloroplastic [Tanacetum cinerariifolium]